MNSSERISYEFVFVFVVFEFIVFIFPVGLITTCVFSSAHEPKAHAECERIHMLIAEKIIGSTDKIRLLSCYLG